MLKFKSKSSNPRFTSSNSRVTSSNPQVASLNLRVSSSNLRATSLNVRITSSNARVTSLNPPFTSSNPRINKPVKTQANSLKSSSYPKIISPTLFDNSRGNSYIQFLVIISCFKFPLFHGYGFSRKLSE